MAIAKRRPAHLNVLYDENEAMALIWLGTSGIPTATCNRLIRHAGSALDVALMEREEIARITNEATAETLMGIRYEGYTQDRLTEAQDLNMRIVTRCHEEYPAFLLDAEDPPLILYVMGMLPMDSARTVAVSGTRTPSRQGERTARLLASDLASQGAVIVSGLSRGIDTAAHLGALDAGGSTIAVLGSGLDVIYPRENDQLFQRILRNGCVISEYPPGTKPASWRFPLRNRIIAGISEGIIVVEAEAESNTRYLVRHAEYQNKAVMVTPSPLYLPTSALPLELIRSGAELITRYEDVGEILGWDR